MPNELVLSIPKLNDDNLAISFAFGESIIFVGANGSGKTRLGVYIESQLAGRGVQRIAAQKSLALNDNFNIVSVERAQRSLRFGADHITNESAKMSARWGNRPATHFLSDFDALLQLLFADHNHIASKYLREQKVGSGVEIPTTQLERLKLIWDGLLPHRALQVDDSSVRVVSNAQDAAAPYPGSEMSDGERAIFYFLGQSLLVPRDGIVIVDEPEAHIHRAILAPLWDAIEKARPDCSFIYITHDLEFAADHNAAQKYFIKAYSHPSRWEIEELPEDTGLPERVVVELVGSRKPILFVEGDLGSLDLTIYRSLYTSFTIIPMGSCDQVIHSVNSYDASPTLHWLDVRGLAHADQRTSSDIAYLAQRSISVLPVAEAENLLLIPSVFLALARALACPNPEELLEELTTKVVEQVTANADLVSARHTVRQLDRRLKRVEVTARDLSSLQSEYDDQLIAIEPAGIFTNFKDKLLAQAQNRNLLRLLEMYENKGLLSIAASLLGVKDQRRLIEKVGRLLGNTQGDELKTELAVFLPSFVIPAPHRA